MDTIKVIHDTKGRTLTIWLDDPAKEAVCEETADEVLLIKDSTGRVIGIEILHYEPVGGQRGMTDADVIVAREPSPER